MEGSQTMKEGRVWLDNGKKRCSFQSLVKGEENEESEE